MESTKSFYTLALTFFLLFLNYSLSISKPLFPIDEEQYRFFKESEKRPLPIGGYEAITKKIIYPEMAIKTKTAGKIYMLIFLDEQGNVDEVKVVQGIGAGCDEAIETAIRKTKFVSGYYQGLAVKSKFPVIMNFQSAQ